VRVKKESKARASRADGEEPARAPRSRPGGSRKKGDAPGSGSSGGSERRESSRPMREAAQKKRSKYLEEYEEGDDDYDYDDSPAAVRSAPLLSSPLPSLVAHLCLRLLSPASCRRSP